MDFVRLVNNVKRFFQDEEYICNENAPELTKEQYTALNVGAVNAEQNCYYCNCLETEPDKEDVKNRLSDYYDIADRASAVETLEWLLNRGHHVYYEAIKGVIANADNEFKLEGLLDEEKTDALLEYTQNLAESIEHLTEEDIIKKPSDLNNIPIDAWDLGRLVLVTRCCYDSKYISESEAWRYITAAYKKSKELYKNWNEFAKGYVIGRAMWNGNNMSLTGIISIAQRLEKDENSPWVKYPLN